MMKQLNLKFDDKELERQYQIHVLKYNMKSFIYYLIITMLGQLVMITDFFLHQNYLLAYIILPGTFTNASFIYWIKKKSLVAKYFYIFTFIFSIQGSTLQILFMYIDQIRGSQTELLICLDIIQQFTMMFNFTDNHLVASFLYIYFLATRLYIHFYNGFQILSLAFLLYGSFYIIDQYQKQKLRRKQFLKTKSNRLLETMIQEFVEDNVCIIEKDKIQIKFNGYLMNNKLKQIGSDINKILQKFKIKSINRSLQDYLYQSIQEKEVLICLYKHYNYQVTYQQFPQNKNKIFLKFICVNYHIKHQINYQMLYQLQSRNLRLLSQTCKEGKQMQNIIKYNTYLYCLEQYFHLYRTKIQNISIQDIKNLLIQKNFRITTQSDIPNIISDKNLIIILIQIISDLMNSGFVTFFIEKQILNVEFLGKQTKQYDKIDYINKILYHIGLQKSIISYQNDLISIKIQILVNLEKKFQI